MATRLGSSFRDPSGFVFVDGGTIFRQVNKSYGPEFRHLESSGLYQSLSSTGRLIPYEGVPYVNRVSSEAFAVIKPERVEFISYPYEWCFSQFKDAALLTLDIQRSALEHGMSLKDASAYNVQFSHGKPIFIDTLSFEIYREGEPWVAYRQFCQHFLAPLALMSLVDASLSQLMRVHIDGIPLALADKLLRGRARFNLGLSLHIRGHAKTQAASSGANEPPKRKSVSKFALLGLIHNLESTIHGFEYRPEGTVWGDYYSSTNYSEGAKDEKARVVSDYVDQITPKPAVLWDLGANTGQFSRIASGKGMLTVAWDFDPAAVERNYIQLREKPDPCLLPLIADLSNPSPGLGWANRERDSFEGRGPADAIMALALVHHLAIGNNVPLAEIAGYFASLGRWLIIEFVPKEDSQVKRLLQSRHDIYSGYNEQGFEQEFLTSFDLVRKETIKDTLRTLYLFCRKSADGPPPVELSPQPTTAELFTGVGGIRS